MDYSALAQLLNQDAQKQAQQNPWMISANNFSQVPTGNNFGATALKGLLSGISASLGERSVERDTNARNESLRGFMSAAPDVQETMLKNDKNLSPFATQLSLMQATERSQAAAKAADRKLALDDELAKINAKADADAKSSGMVKPVEMATDLRKELMGSPEYKNYSTVVQSAKNIKELAKKNDPVSNLGLIYSTIKLVDPTSAVKEGEVDMVNLSQGPLARMSGEIEYSLKNGGKLQESTRKKLVEMAGLFAKTAKDAYKTQESPRLDIANRYGVNAQDLGLLPDFEMDNQPQQNISSENQAWLQTPAGQQWLASRGGR